METGRTIKMIFKIDPKIQNFGVEKVYLLRDFTKYCLRFLDIKGDVKINLKNGKDKNLQTLASYSYHPGNDTADDVYLRAGGRHVVDIMRSLAHELIHKRQNERGELTDESGIAGSPHENEANSLAGVIMRQYTKEHNHILDIE